MSIIARFALSLDGFSAGLDRWPGVADGAGALAMGRTTFDRATEMRWWPRRGRDLHVLTSRPLPADEPGAAVTAHGDPASLVAALRDYRPDVHLLGGPRTIQTLIELGAIDRLEVRLVPVLLGDGTPLVVDEASARDLRLDGSEAYPDSVVGLSYEFA
jgi:dihydrofolate reductase